MHDVSAATLQNALHGDLPVSLLKASSITLILPPHTCPGFASRSGGPEEGTAGDEE